MVETFSGIDTKTIDYVKDFIKKTRNFELIVNTQKANSLYPENTRLTLGQILAGRLGNFRNAKSLFQMQETAKPAKFWIDYAFDNGVIDQGSGLMGELEKCRSDLTVKQNELAEIGPKFERLKIERDQLIKENNGLKTENERLKMQIEKI